VTYFEPTETWRYSSTHSLTSVLDGGEWSASHPGCFTPRERAQGTHRIEGWVGPGADLDAVAKRKIPNPSRESNLERLALSIVATTTELSRLCFWTDVGEYWALTGIRTEYIPNPCETRCRSSSPVPCMKENATKAKRS
jgi:hypothetical protein